MKLRTDGQSIRLRLRRSEVARFGESGVVTVRLPFPGRYLQYSLESADVPELSACLEGDCIRVAVPKAIASEWATGDEVGVYGVHNSIAISIEKDFRRTARSSPDDHDLYPNPRSKAEA